MDTKNDEIGEALSGFLPPLQLNHLLNNSIDKSLH